MADPVRPFNAPVDLLSVMRLNAAANRNNNNANANQAAANANQAAANANQATAPGNNVNLNNAGIPYIRRRRRSRSPSGDPFDRRRAHSQDPPANRLQGPAPQGQVAPQGQAAPPEQRFLPPVYEQAYGMITER